MVKKVLLGTLFAGLLTVLVVGAVNRTVAKTENDADTHVAQGQGRNGDRSDMLAYGGRGQQAASSQARGQGQGQQAASSQARGQGQGQQAVSSQMHGQGQQAASSEAHGQGQLEQAQGNGNGRNTGGSAAGAAGGVPYAETEDHAWESRWGVVQSIDADQMTIRTSAGDIQVIDRPWSFAQQQGFQAKVGDQVSLNGFYEDDTFEVGGLVNVSTGQETQIREQSGRPLWAGGRGRQG
jgi:hypothetical protein